jgi:hypothetical protein
MYWGRGDGQQQGVTRQRRTADAWRGLTTFGATDYNIDIRHVVLLKARAELFEMLLADVNCGYATC